MSVKTQTYNRNGIRVTVYPFGLEYIVARETSKGVTEKHFLTSEAAFDYCKRNALYEKDDIKKISMNNALETIREKRAENYGRPAPAEDANAEQKSIFSNPNVEIT